MLSEQFRLYLEKGYTAEDALLSVCPCVSITVCGNYEKTTCMKILKDMYEAVGKKVYYYMSVDTEHMAMDLDNMKQSDVVILKLTLDSLKHKLHKNAHISIITNIIPYPMEKGMSYYDLIQIFAQSYIYQKESDYVILSRDYHYLKSVLPQIPGQLLGFSPRQRISAGIGVRNTCMCIFKDDTEIELVKTNELKLPGLRKMDGYMAATAAASAVEMNTDVIKDVLLTFTGAEDHYELVASKNGVRFFNNANSYMPSHTVQAFQPYDQKIVLLTGGPESELPYCSLAMEIIAFVKVLVIYGESAELLEQETKLAPFYDEEEIKIIKVNSISQGAAEAYKHALPGDTIIFSPSSGNAQNLDAIRKSGREFRDTVIQL